MKKLYRVPFAVAIGIISACSTSQGRLNDKLTTSNKHEARALAQATLSIQIQYYYSPARVINLVDGSTSSQNVLLARTVDPNHGTITEIACITFPNRPPMLSPVYMRVSQNKATSAYSITAMSMAPDFSDTKMLTGTGTLSGTPWNWNHLNFSMKTDFCPQHCPAQVEDTNFLVHGQDVNGNVIDQLIGRKQIFSNGVPIELYDLEMNLITSDQYSAYYSQMGCPAQGPQ